MVPASRTPLGERRGPAQEPAEHVVAFEQPHPVGLATDDWRIQPPRPPARGPPDAPQPYRVGQLVDVHPTGDRFRRPADFDLAAYWRSYLDELDRRRHEGSAEVRLSRSGLERLAEVMGGRVADAAAASATADACRGWVRATIPIEAIEHAAAELLRMGTDVEVLAPLVLRQRIATTVRELAARYAV